MAVIGHARVRSALVSSQYPVVLLTGPESVGKWAVAEEVARSWTDHPGAIVRHRTLDADDVRTIEYASSLMYDWGARYVLIGLDRSADLVQNMLLKFLERPPEGVHVVLVSAGAVLPTIRSRAQCFRFGLLTDEEVERVLIQLGMAKDVARKQAPLGGGRVRPAMEGIDTQARAQVVSVLRALHAGSASQLDTALRGWNAEAHLLLLAWASEASSGRFHTTTGDMAPQFGQLAARRILRALGTLPHASARLTAHAALAPLCPEP